MVKMDWHTEDRTLLHIHPNLTRGTLWDFSCKLRQYWSAILRVKCMLCGPVLSAVFLLLVFAHLKSFYIIKGSSCIVDRAINIY